VKILFIFLFLSVLFSAGAQQLAVTPGKVDSLKKAIRSNKGLPKARSLCELSKIYTTYNIDSTKQMVDEALAICRDLKNDTTFIWIAASMQYPLGSVGEKDLARKYLVEARDMKSPEAMRPICRSMINVGLYFIHYWNYTQYDSSVYYGLKTMELAVDNISKADRSILVGAAYNKMGDNIKALEYYKSAETLLNEATYFPGEYCYLYNQLGTLYADEGDLKKSEQFYLKSIALGKKAGGFPQVSPVTNLAVVYDRMGDYDKALKYLDSATILLPLETDPWRKAINIRNKGKVLTHAGKPKEGIAETLNAMEIYTRLKDNYTVARLHLQLAEPYRLQGNFKKAEQEALLALEWDRAHGYGELVKESYRELARIYTATRQFGKAFEYQNRYLEILDSLNSADRKNKFVQLEKNFEMATQEKTRQHLEREKELYQAQAQAERKVRIYLTAGTILLAGAVIISVVAYRRMRSQNALLAMQNRKIEEQTQQLQEAAKTKSRFFANVSHELRTPVTLLNGMLELMKENSSPNNTSKKLDIALTSSRRLQSMLNEVLDLSRVEAGELKLNCQRQELFPLLNRIVMAFESLLVRKQITLKLDIDSIKNLSIDLDEDKFEKVINNLMQNAIKFNREGGWINVTAHRSDTSVVIQVEDSGVGIAEKDLPFVFDRFYQAASTDQLNSQGIGIGLSLVRDFTELHGGEVTVSSHVNEGSCFSVRLPLMSGDYTAEEPAEDTTRHLPEVDFNSFAKRPEILVVEDNDEMRFYLKEILGQQVSLSEARHGQEALTWLQSHTPDLIISDVMMPLMDGPAFLKHLKSSETHRRIPVVMLTARASEEDLLQGLSLGVDDYIIKPFNARELKIRIHNLITNQQIRQEVSQKEAEADELIMPAGPAEDEIFITKVRDFVEARISHSGLGVGDLCDHLAISERQLYRKAATLTGMTPNQLVKEIRMKAAYRLLLERKVAKVSDLAKRVGFENPSYFSRQFEERFGRRPAEMI
jgi:signal transduction histidine kinase/CheY-like chemotaxis protein/AraC-like DNA-binding protein